MEKVINNNNLIPNDQSALPLRQNNNNNGSIITTLMSTHLVKKPQDNDVLFKSERPKNDDDIDSIETKLTEMKKPNDIFSRENLISIREFGIPEKKIVDEVIILSKDKIDKETKRKEYEKELKTNMEIHKKNMEKDEEKIKKYYRRRNTNNNKAISAILALLLVIIFILVVVLIIVLVEKN